MITYVFRKRLPTVFSIEKIFDTFFIHFEKSGERVRRLELPHISSGIPQVLKNAWFVARLRNKGVLHITGDAHYAGIFCPFTKTIITVHDCVVLQRGVGFKRLVLWIIWFWLPLRLASVVTVISEQTKREILRNVAIPENKIKVIPNFVDPALQFSLRPYASAQPRILHIGTTANKNLSNVIAALRGTSCVLVIVGRVPEAERKALEDAAALYENYVGIDDAHLARLYRDADIISFPSTYEGFGMPILEGQAVGRVVLTSNLEPMRSVAGEGGAVLVNPHSVEAIRNGFLTLIGDGQLRARLISAGKENCLRFTLKSVAASYLDIYRSLQNGG